MTNIVAGSLPKSRSTRRSISLWESFSGSTASHTYITASASDMYFRVISEQRTLRPSVSFSFVPNSPGVSTIS